MAGLLDGLLPFLYSQSDRLKRRVKDFVAEPGGALAQVWGQANDDAGELLANTRSATTEGMKYGPATEKLAGALASAYNPAGITVYHGSPHVFNVFDASKIGTGEGAQAYGHGLYTAESPDVAKQYATALSDLDRLTPEGRAARALQAANGDHMAAKRALYGEYNQSAGTPYGDAAWNAVQALEGGKVKAPNLYKVDLPDEAIAKMLDWDKPLSQQPEEARQLLESAWRADQRRGLTSGAGEPTGGDAYASLRMLTPEWKRGGAGQQDASEMLRRAGIPGIRYLDQQSRNAGGWHITPPEQTTSGKWMVKSSDYNSKGMHFDTEAEAQDALADKLGSQTSNFVVFPGSENLLRILERNGTPLD